MERSAEKLLISELSKGSIIAFNDLYNKYCDCLFSFSLLLLKNHHGAEEVVQHVFIKVWEKRATLNPELSFKSYIFTITKNHIFKLLSQSLKKKIQIDELNTHFHNCLDNPSFDLIYSELKEKARIEISDLPGQRRKVFIMRRRLNLTNYEIADILDISVNTVKRHMNLALKSLDQVLISHYIFILIAISLQH
ncbi:MAG: RNA polymerase sigma-70 factor [Bacteroidales bacterium]|nr:RNA polymerase sigma-70 factor [Bacteroidales bacterium]